MIRTSLMLRSGAVRSGWSLTQWVGFLQPMLGQEPEPEPEPEIAENQGAAEALVSSWQERILESNSDDDDDDDDTPFLVQEAGEADVDDDEDNVIVSTIAPESDGERLYTGWDEGGQYLTTTLFNSNKEDEGDVEGQGRARDATTMYDNLQWDDGGDGAEYDSVYTAVSSLMNSSEYPSPLA